MNPFQLCKAVFTLTNSGLAHFYRQDQQINLTSNFYQWHGINWIKITNND